MNQQDQSAPAQGGRTLPSWPARMLRRELPYIAMLALALGGIAYTDLAPDGAVVFWQILVPVFAAICILTQWPRARDRGGRQRLVWTQVLHWGVVLLAMRLLFLERVQAMLNIDALGLGVLCLLALGTLLAGIHAVSWQVGVVGVLLALAIPAIALLESLVLLMLLAGVAALAITAAVLWFRRGRPLDAA